MKQTSLLLLLVTLLLTACQSPNSSGYTDLFNGKDLTGWKANMTPDSFSVVNGVLKAHSTDKGSHLLYVGKKYKDFELVVVSKSEPNSNSGIYFHTDGTSRVKAGWLHTGYEAQLNSTAKEKRKTGSLYAIQDLAKSPVDETKWFEMKIRVEGKRIQIWVDGQQTADYTEPENPERPANKIGRLLDPNGGFVALQAHDTKSVWYFKEIKIKEL
ncbi:MAG: DUF1080 domain-containing protein [Lentisphaeraceae bacterium]|nr:DUF1080 domain-containing protein [Lentisphaeraceae bacterium]